MIPGAMLPDGATLNCGGGNVGIRTYMSQTLCDTAQMGLHSPILVRNDTIHCDSGQFQGQPGLNFMGVGPRGAPCVPKPLGKVHIADPQAQSWIMLSSLQLQQKCKTTTVSFKINNTALQDALIKP